MCEIESVSESVLNCTLTRNITRKELGGLKAEHLYRAPARDGGMVLPPAQRDARDPPALVIPRLGLIWPTVKSSVKSGATEGFHMNFTVISCERAKCEISLTNPACALITDQQFLYGDTRERVHNLHNSQRPMKP